MTILLQIGLNAITSYKRLAYTPWHAIAEFVDNSTQSFFNNRDILESLSQPDQRPLKITIEYSRSEDFLSITDNAMGMSLEDLRLALLVAHPPTNTLGRSKYGMGLKTAASWMGDVWSIETKKYGEGNKYFVRAEVDQIAAGNGELFLDTIPNQTLEDHFTIIRITHHNRHFYTRTLSKIKDHLSSMYREDFRNGILTLIWQGETLSWKEVDLLEDRTGKPYRKSFDFKVPSETLAGVPTEKSVDGWVGILKEGSRSKAGFSILHSGRVIKGWPDAWRPESLYGQIQGSNDLVNQRLVGEINLDAFDVSHTKDDILWLGDEEENIEAKLYQHCSDYRETALNYRKRSDDERGPTEAAIRTALDAFKKELKSPEMTALIIQNPMLPEALVEQVVATISNSIIGRIPETFRAEIGDLSVIGFVDEMSISDPYLTIDTAKPSEVIVIVNASHPHWNQLRTPDSILNYLRHCVYDGIAEAQARDRSSARARINPNTVKLLKDRLLRIPFEIEQNDSIDPDETT